MNVFLALINNKGFMDILKAIGILIILFFLWDNISTSISNNITQKVNINEQKNQIETLKSNQAATEEKQKDELKVKEFNVKVEEKVKEIQKSVNTYKKVEPKVEAYNDKKTVPIKTSNKPIYFNLD